jgi:hypothetical protein
MGVAEVMLVSIDRRPGILDAVHALRPSRSKVVVKLGARRAPSLTRLCGHDTHALCGPCMVPSMHDDGQGLNTSVRGTISEGHFV